jgi:hypothetical protein
MLSRLSVDEAAAGVRSTRTSSDMNSDTVISGVFGTTDSEDGTVSRSTPYSDGDLYTLTDDDASPIGYRDVVEADVPVASSADVTPGTSIMLQSLLASRGTRPACCGSYRVVSGGFWFSVCSCHSAAPSVANQCSVCNRCLLLV